MLWMWVGFLPVVSWKFLSSAHRNQQSSILSGLQLLWLLPGIGVKSAGNGIQKDSKRAVSRKRHCSFRKENKREVTSHCSRTEKQRTPYREHVFREKGVLGQKSLTEEIRRSERNQGQDPVQENKSDAGKKGSQLRRKRVAESGPCLLSCCTFSWYGKFFFSCAALFILRKFPRRVGLALRRSGGGQQASCFSIRQRAKELPVSPSGEDQKASGFSIQRRRKKLPAYTAGRVTFSTALETSTVGSNDNSTKGSNCMGRKNQLPHASGGSSGWILRCLDALVCASNQSATPKG
ncbi:uncharacterized protein LOC129754029 [Uranotaenia lowii]|uniref:uncharacterized protein LOC129754029 n=1 Tax=Uranotaenia lowii TaxID=190385 RepID=UPI0024791A17|nr:uncharacterized protein LOC129754029 [Uranotaenia lowii]